MVGLTKFIAVAALAVTSATVAHAQGVTSPIKPFSFGVSGGAAIPVGDLSNGTNTGYNITGSLALALPAVPFGIRGDAAFNSFGVNQDVANSLGADNGNIRILGFTGNIVLPLPLQGTVLRPYVIGGAGLYTLRASASLTSGGSSSSGSISENDFGFNIGGGLTIPLSGFNTFIEARYHRVNSGGGSTSFVPITFGVMF